MKHLLSLFSIFFLTTCYLLLTTTSHAADPLSSPNNRYGIHLINTDSKEASIAASLVNSQGGDWGYVTVIVESKGRDHQKWQKFFDELRKLHLIPIVRLATEPDGDTWKKPLDGEPQAWADFLDALNWPTKTRFITIYNEPNHSTEWGGTTNPGEYAQILDKTITALKQKNPDFFVLNAGLDASTPHKPPNYFDELEYLKQMSEEVPGIFNKLDGWSSHSYPNPGFVGSPQDSGRGTVRTWQWELAELKKLGLTKDLPVFITETGWKHSQGDKVDNSLPSPDKVGEFYKDAFENAWNNHQVVTVTPFLLNYQSSPFDHFSFTTQEDVGLGNILKNGHRTNQFHPQFYAIQSLPKTSGKPIQENKAQLVKGEIYKTLVAGETYEINLTFKNTGQSIWNESKDSTVQLFPQQGANQLGIIATKIPEDKKIEPYQSYTFTLVIKAPESGTFKTVLNLYSGGKQFDSKPFEFMTEVKAPVQLSLKASLKWKENFAGDYILKVFGIIGQTMDKVTLSPAGTSGNLPARNLLPDYTYDFTLERPFYQSKTISQRVSSGDNSLDFGELQPDISSAILNPQALWQILPFSN